MTTITIDTPIDLPKTHFHDMNELSKVLLQWQFETELEASVAKNAQAPLSDFVRI